MKNIHRRHACSERKKGWQRGLYKYGCRNRCGFSVLTHAANACATQNALNKAYWWNACLLATHLYLYLIKILITEQRRFFSGPFGGASEDMLPHWIIIYCPSRIWINIIGLHFFRLCCAYLFKFSILILNFARNALAHRNWSGWTAASLEKSRPFYR